jgi:hypothetical protein
MTTIFDINMFINVYVFTMGLIHGLQYSSKVVADNEAEPDKLKNDMCKLFQLINKDNKIIKE